MFRKIGLLLRHCVAATALLLGVVSGAAAQAPKGDPVKVGFSMSLTGATAPNGRQLLVALEIWRDDVNAAGGLLGRPVELVYYDDQSNPANVPALYQKLLSVDKVDLLLGPYSTNMAAPAMPAIMQAGKTTISLLAIGVNRHFNYDRYFSMVPVGTEGIAAFSRGFFELAAQQNPKPTTVAMISADAEFARTAADGAKENAQKLGFKVIYDRSYPPGTTDFGRRNYATQEDWEQGTVSDCVDSPPDDGWCDGCRVGYVGARKTTCRGCFDLMRSERGGWCERFAPGRDVDERR